MSLLPSVIIELPAWLQERVAQGIGPLPEPEQRMEFVIELSEENVRRGTGGPFAAAVFDSSSGELIAPGVNLVVPARNSVAHAEMVALMVAQQRRGTHDLGAPGQPPCELVSSTEPCAMCMGAVPWSGVGRLVCGARDEDARAIGMDEGIKPEDWITGFEQRGIQVVRDVCRARAAAVLRHYVEQGGPIYNGRQGVAPSC